MWPWYQTPPDVDTVVCAQPPELIELEIMRVQPNVLDCYDGMLYMVLYHQIHAKIDVMAKRRMCGCMLSIIHAYTIISRPYP